MESGRSSVQGSAIAKWAETVRAEHEQADRFRSDELAGDHWKKLAHRFEPATRERAFQDETLQAVMKFVRSGDTVLDVGAGAGRIAVPLADICKHVTAVEPSNAMRERMSAQAKAWGVKNLGIASERWEEAEVDPADVVVCAHVVYTAENIELFLRKLTEVSRRDVIVVVFEEPAMANYFPLWEMVYGERRIALPALNELKNVLEEMQVKYSSEPLSEWQSRPFNDFESAYDESLARLFMSPGPANKHHTERLKEVLQAELEQSEDGLRFNWAKPHRPWLVHWTV